MIRIARSVAALGTGLVLALALAACAAAPALAQQLPQKVWNIQSPMVPLGYCQTTGVVAVTSMTTLATCLSGIPATATYALVQAETVAVRWRDDGTNPTAAIGQPASALQAIYVTVNPLSNFAVIPQSGTATINVTFYGVR